MPKNKTPHRISAAEHAANKQSTREIRAEIRAIDSKMKARWLAEKPQALAALALVRAMPDKAERTMLLRGPRLSGEPFANAVLRHCRLRDMIWRAFADGFAANRAAVCQKTREPLFGEKEDRAS